MNKFYAHSKPETADKNTWHSLSNHLSETACRAARFAEAWGAGDWGYLAGLWHDIGKYSDEFQKRLSALGGENAHIEHASQVDHSTAGAQHAMRVLAENGFGKALAFAIAGHHGGLPDGIASDSCLRSRLEKDIPPYRNCPADLLDPVALKFPLATDTDRVAIRLSLFIRMLYSCLVDADFLDTESFMDPERGANRAGYPTLASLETIFFENLEKLQQSASPSPVNTVRNEVLEQCILAGAKDAGLFSLTVPTGGGKTLSSMAFALKHARRHSLKRIIYVIPYTTIIEQNAAVFRAMLGHDAVLEHHSNFEPDSEDHRTRLASENWDAPIIVTTNVQFFESLFAHRSSRCRKLHNIAESVVILDEVQTLPPAYLLPCLEVLNELSESYRTSIVLCSATQPAVQHRADFIQGLTNVRELVKDPNRLAQSLQRTTINIIGRIKEPDLHKRIAKHKQVLCVVNTRKHARDLYHGIADEPGAFHLSALMCPKHRSLILDQIRAELEHDRPCRVISTQLIEAGVDIDFPVVYRSMAGVDSIAQAAGRCNREGKRDGGEVFVFIPESMPGGHHFKETAQAAESVIRTHGSDVLSLRAIEDYFKLYYWTRGEALDQKQILAELQKGCGNGDFPFKSVSESFRFIDNIARPVIIPYDKDARGLIATLPHLDNPASLTRKLQKYTVSVYPKDWDALLTDGDIEIKANLFPVLINQARYSNHLGLCPGDKAPRPPEDLIV